MSDENLEVEIESKGTETEVQASNEAVPAEKPKKEDAPSSADQEASAEKPKKEPEKKGVQKRIDELVRQREEARKEAEYWKEKNAKSPDSDDFESYEDYLAEKVSFNLRRQQEEDYKRKDAQYQEQIAAERESEFLERVSKAKEVYEDFDAVVGNPKLPITEQMAEVIKEHESGPDIAYYLGKHPEEAARISNDSPYMAAVKMGELVAKLSMQKPQVTKTPDPVEPIDGKNSPTVNTSNMTTEEWMSWRRKQLYG